MSSPRLATIVISSLLMADAYFICYAVGLNIATIKLNPGVKASLNVKDKNSTGSSQTSATGQTKTGTSTGGNAQGGIGSQSTGGNAQGGTGTQSAGGNAQGSTGSQSAGEDAQGRSGSESGSSGQSGTSGPSGQNGSSQTSQGSSGSQSTAASRQGSSQTSSGTIASTSSTTSSSSSDAMSESSKSNQAKAKFQDLDRTENRLVDSLKKAAAAGVLDTSEDNLFHPNDPVSRADFTRWMVRMKQIPETVPSTPSYADVTNDNPYFKDIESATTAQMVQGYPKKGSKEKDFKPEQFITRQEFAVMYGTFSGKRSRAEKLTPKDEKDYLRYDPEASKTSSFGYKDEGEIDDWARRWVAVAQQAGVLDQAFDCNPGTTDVKRRLLHPQQRMTRAESVNILVKLYGISARKTLKNEKSRSSSKEKDTSRTVTQTTSTSTTREEKP